MTNKRAIFGITLVVLGLLFLGRTMDLFYFDIGDLFRIIIPLGIIALGFWLIVRKRHKEAMIDEQTYEYSYTTTADSGTNQSAGPSSSRLSQTSSGSSFSGGSNAQAETVGVGSGTRTRYAKTFGDMVIDCTGVNLENVEVSSTFGDLEVRVHGGTLSPGLNRLIISGFLGDIRVQLPQDMAVLIHINSTAGDAEAIGKKVSGFGNTIEAQTPDYGTADRKLFIAINTFIGDVRVLRI